MAGGVGGVGGGRFEGLGREGLRREAGVRSVVVSSKSAGFGNEEVGVVPLAWQLIVSAGKLLASCWQSAGRLLARCWQAASKPRFARLHRTPNPDCPVYL